MPKLFLPRHGRTHGHKGSDPTPIKHTLLVVVDSGGLGLTTGIKGDVQMHKNFIIESWTLLADTSGSIVIDIWKDAYANYPPTDADSITAAAPPTITGSDKATSSTLTGWTTQYLAGDTLRFNIDSVSAIGRVTLALELDG